MTDKPERSEEVRRRYSLTLEVEAEDLDTLRACAARAASRLERGAEVWDEAGDTHAGRLKVTSASEAAAKRANEKLPLDRTRRGE